MPSLWCTFPVPAHPGRLHRTVVPYCGVRGRLNRRSFQVLNS